MTIHPRWLPRAQTRRANPRHGKRRSQSLVELAFTMPLLLLLMLGTLDFGQLFWRHRGPDDRVTATSLNDASEQ